MSAVDPIASEPEGSTPLPAVMAAACAAGLFVWLHVANYHAFLAPAWRHTPDLAIGRSSLGWEMLGFGFVALAVYAGFALAGCALAAKGAGRVLWMVPASLFVLSPVAGMLAMLDRAALRPILEPYGASESTRLLFALGDLVLVLLPGAVVARRGRARRVSLDGSARIAFLSCAGLGVLVYSRQQYLAQGTLDVNVEAHLTLGVLFVVGAMLGTKRRWFPWVHLGVALLLSSAPMVTAEWIVPHGVWSVPAREVFRQIGLGFAPSLLALGLGASSDPLARYLRRRRGVSGVASRSNLRVQIDG